MKKEILLITSIIASIVLAFVVNAHCAHTGYPWQAQLYFLIALFLFFVCLSAMFVTEKQYNDIISIIGANVGTGVLIFSVIIAFLNIKWWIVLLFIPLTWLLAGQIGGRIARKLPASWLYFLIAVGLFSFMIHAFYKILF